MNVSKRWTICSLLCLLCLSAVTVVVTANDHEDPRIKKFRWIETDTGYEVTATVQKGFNSDILESVNSGIPTTFNYYLYFKQRRWYWDNRVMAEAKYKHTVVYDTLRKIYTVTIERHDKDQPIAVHNTQDPDEMRALMSTFQGYLILDRNDLKSNRQYYISLRAKMETDKLPAPWNAILFFMSGDFDTKTSRQWLSIKRTENE